MKDLTIIENSFLYSLCDQCAVFVTVLWRTNWKDQSEKVSYQVSNISTVKGTSLQRINQNFISDTLADL